MTFISGDSLEATLIHLAQERFREIMPRFIFKRFIPSSSALAIGLAAPRGSNGQVPGLGPLVRDILEYKMPQMHSFAFHYAVSDYSSLPPLRIYQPIVAAGLTSHPSPTHAKF
jgi:hypothetical protein